MESTKSSTGLAPRDHIPSSPCPATAQLTAVLLMQSVFGHECVRAAQPGATQGLLSKDSTDTLSPSSFQLQLPRPLSLTLADLEELQTTEEIRHVTSQRLQ